MSRTMNKFFNSGQKDKEILKPIAYTTKIFTEDRKTNVNTILSARSPKDAN